MRHNPFGVLDVDDDDDEESPQIQYPGTRVSSQPKIREVEQASGKRKHASKLIFKAKQAHLPKLFHLRR